MGGCSKETDAFTLPSSTPKGAISVKFSPNSLSLSITESVPASVLPTRPDHFGMTSRHHRATGHGTRRQTILVVCSLCIWINNTSKRGGARSSELWLIRESLEKFTAALLTGEDLSGWVYGRGVPSIGEGEMDLDG
ncbi:hypothetical protein BT96DRAFT_992931 [Gymnopus androsaceus JB14]|uniref:Uncharacterized protein n=1 Tax=Gymnopus androsaceus JB14 TaxID=1447944 RepID=A0A6A4HSY2_9AGAR|nr:hypothetical protein BT96DRAFT_992931 [Gymnopus androsaceus JB14]